MNPSQNVGSELPSGLPLVLHATAQEACDFQFVEVGEPSKQDGETRSVIRAHVMKVYHEKRRQGKEPHHDAEIRSAGSVKQGAPQVLRCKSGPDGLRELAKRRKRQGSTARKREGRAPTLNTCVIPAQTASATPLTPLHKNESFDLSIDRPGEERPAKNHETALHNPAHLIGSDALVTISGAVDPFCTLPLPVFPRIQVLLYHGQ